MLFKLFYCDDPSTARHVFSEYQYAGYDTGIYDRANCATFDIFQNARNYADSRIIIKDSNGKEKYNDRLSYWRNYIIIFEDNTIVSLFRDFNPHEDSKQNRDKINAFVDAIREKFNQPSAVIIQDDDEDFVV